jgi:hypothetical protein
MVKVYAIVLAAGVVLLIAWIFATYLGRNVAEWARFDPEERLGKPGRRLISGLVGFGMAGMSAEFSPFDLSWPVGLVLAIAGASAMAWYAGWVDRLRSEGRSPEGRSPEARPPEGRPPEGRSPEGRSPEGRPPEGRPVARTGTDQS